MSRNQEVLRARRAGHTYTQIANMFGISKGRAYQIVKDEEVRDSHFRSPNWKGELSRRAANAVFSELCEATETYVRDIPPDDLPRLAAEHLSREQLLNLPNFGAKSLIEVLDWLQANGLTLRP